MIDNQTKKNTIIVSDKFVDIFSNFNVVSQVEKMQELSQKELYLLLTLCLDKFLSLNNEQDDPVVKFNLIPFKQEIMAIFDIQDDKEPTNQVLIDLIEETGDKYIETDNIVCCHNLKLPEPLSKEEVRDVKINIINKD